MLKPQAQAKLDLAGIVGRQRLAGALVVRADSPDIGTVEQIKALGQDLGCQIFGNSDISLQAEVEGYIARTNECLAAEIAGNTGQRHDESPVCSSDRVGGARRMFIQLLSGQPEYFDRL